jgi:hypothetical protein
MVNVVKGVGVHPPLSPAQANFTLMTECTPESRRYYSVYSVVLPTTVHALTQVKAHFSIMAIVVYSCGYRFIQGGRAQHDFSLAWLEAALIFQWKWTRSDLKLDVRRQEF